MRTIEGNFRRDFSVVKQVTIDDLLCKNKFQKLCSLENCLIENNLMYLDPSLLILQDLLSSLPSSFLCSLMEKNRGIKKGYLQFVLTFKKKNTF